MLRDLLLSTDNISLLALNKPNILIPLSREASRGDQILNAESFERQGFSYVLYEEELKKESLLEAVEQVMTKKEGYTQAMEQSDMNQAVIKIADIIDRNIL